MRPIPLAGLVGLVLTTPLQAQMVLGKVQVPEPSFQATNTEITPIEDTFLRENSPNDNNGNQGRMRIKGKISNSRVHRGLVRFDQQEIVNAVGSETLTSATLELAVDAASGWSGSGRYVGVHRVTQAWTELGATWNCADDTDRTNADLDCAPGDLWDMEASPASLPFVDVPTDSMLVLNGSAGQTVAVDVTADVQSFLSGSETNLGWIVAKRDEGSNGDVEVSSRSGTSPPRLTIVTASNEVPPIPDDPFIPSQQASNLTIPFPPDTSRVYVRDVFKIRFEEGATDAEKAAFFSAFGATVIGGSLFTGEYTIRVPDPGESFADYDSLRTALRAAPNIRWVVDVRLRGGIMQMLGSSRYPNDGPGFKRADYFADPNSSATWRYNAIRAPEGWSCATGRYAGSFRYVPP